MVKILILSLPGKKPNEKNKINENTVIPLILFKN